MKKTKVDLQDLKDRFEILMDKVEHEETDDFVKQEAGDIRDSFNEDSDYSDFKWGIARIERIIQQQRLVDGLVPLMMDGILCPTSDTADWINTVSLCPNTASDGLGDRGAFMDGKWGGD